MSEPAPPRAPEALTLARLREVVDILEEGVAILGSDGVVEFVNPSGEEILGVPAGELLGWKLLDFRWGLVDEAGDPLPRTMLPPLRVLETGKADPPRIVGMTSPAVPATRWIEVSARPLHADGETHPQGAVASFRDVSARRAAEQALQVSERRYLSLAASVPTGIMHVDVDGRCTWVNNAVTEITGFPAERYLGMGWIDSLHPEDRDAVMAEWRRTEASGAPYVMEHRLLRPDGGVRWVICRTARQEDDHGGFTGYVGSITDVTAAKNAAQVKDQVIGLVSHELRAPLVAIRGGLSFLEPYVRDADEDGRRLYAMAMRNAELLERLVRDLLDIDRLEAGQLKLAMEERSAAAIFRAAVEVIQPLAEERGVSVLLPADDGTVVWGDEDRLLQVFTNLLSNAVKFSEPGGRVELGVSTSHEGVTMWVRDRGRGIPAAYHERIFERFGQVEGADAADRGGAGLGLAISRAIAHAHGGRLWVQSTRGDGATFFLRLPVAML